MGAAAHELTILLAGGVTRVTLGTGQTLRIGRSSANGVVLDLPGVSAVHAEVFLRAAPDGARRLCIRDTSKNGVGIRKRGVAMKRGRPEAWERVPNGEILELGDSAELKLPLKSRIDDKQLPEAKRIMKLSLAPSATPARAASELAEGDPKAIAAMIQGLAASAGTSVAEIIAQMGADGSSPGAAKPGDASLGKSPQATSPGPAAWMDDDVDRPKAKKAKVVDQRLTASALAALGEERSTAPPERDLSVSPISSPGVAKKKKKKAESAGTKDKKKKKAKVEEAKKEKSKAKREPAEAAPKQKEKRRK